MLLAGETDALDRFHLLREFSLDLVERFQGRGPPIGRRLLGPGRMWERHFERRARRRDHRVVAVDQDAFDRRRAEIDADKQRLTSLIRPTLFCFTAADAA